MTSSRTPALVGGFNSPRLSSIVSTVALACCTACSEGSGGFTPDSRETHVAPDTSGASALLDSAKATLATLASRATFDSVVMVQPPHDGNRLPAMAVCGRMGGLPGRSTPARFVYQSKWTVFVEEDANLTAFSELWARTCAAPGGTVVVRE